MVVLFLSLLFTFLPGRACVKAALVDVVSPSGYKLLLAATLVLGYLNSAVGWYGFRLFMERLRLGVFGVQVLLDYALRLEVSFQWAATCSCSAFTMASLALRDDALG